MEGLQFFDGFNWQELVGMFFALFFGFLPGFNIFQWLKAKWNIDGQKAHYMVLAGSVVLTLAAMLVTGGLDLSGFEFTLENILFYAGMVYAASQVAYKRFKDSQDAKLAEVPE